MKSSWQLMSWELRHIDISVNQTQHCINHILDTWTTLTIYFGAQLVCASLLVCIKKTKENIPPCFIIAPFNIHFLGWGIFWKAGRIASVRFCGKELKDDRIDKQGKHMDRILKKEHLNSTIITSTSDSKQVSIYQNWSWNVHIEIGCSTCHSFHHFGPLFSYYSKENKRVNWQSKAIQNWLIYIKPNLSILFQEGLHFLN